MITDRVSAAPDLPFRSAPLIAISGGEDERESGIVRRPWQPRRGDRAAHAMQATVGARDTMSKSLQLGVSFVGGYVAGGFCAIVSHPADNHVSFFNNAKSATVGDAVKKTGMLGLFTRGLPLRIVMIVEYSEDVFQREQS